MMQSECCKERMGLDPEFLKNIPWPNPNPVSSSDQLRMSSGDRAYGLVDRHPIESRFHARAFVRFALESTNSSMSRACRLQGGRSCELGDFQGSPLLPSAARVRPVRDLRPRSRPSATGDSSGGQPCREDRSAFRGSRCAPRYRPRSSGADPGKHSRAQPRSGPCQP